MYYTAHPTLYLKSNFVPQKKGQTDILNRQFLTMLHMVIAMKFEGIGLREDNWIIKRRYGFCNLREERLSLESIYHGGYFGNAHRDSISTYYTHINN